MCMASWNASSTSAAIVSKVGNSALQEQRADDGRGAAAPAGALVHGGAVRNFGRQGDLETSSRYADDRRVLQLKPLQRRRLAGARRHARP